MQQESANQTNETLLFCEIHSDSQLISINLGEKKHFKSRMLCTKCLIHLLNTDDKSQKIIYLQEFLKNPGTQLLKLMNINFSESIIDEKLTLKEIENLLIKIEGDFKSQLIAIRQTIEQIRQLVGSIATELENNLNITDLINKFEALRRIDKYQGSRQLKEFEEKLDFVSKNLIQKCASAKEKFTSSQKQILKNSHENFQKIKSDLDLLNKKTSVELFNKIICQINIDDICEFPQIHELISDGRYIEYILLYQGTRDGLNAQQYWSKCNGQSNLLTLMTSKNGNKFGGYSPCVINMELNTYVSDTTMKSFLFQYNKKEIYQVKNKTNAIFCHPSFGPNFGADLRIGQDFNSGSSSSLGTNYDISSYKIADKATHIFGETTPQLQECKVYKVIFQ